jgi:2,5-diketo-D-gluconate reductase A
MGEDRSVDIGAGIPMPMLGFGTWEISHNDTYAAVRASLDAGYRHIDTAYGYHNEDEIGRAVADSAVPREQIFITTKIPSRRIGLEDETVANSLTGLRTDYVDLWLIHDPPEGEKSIDLWQFFIGLREKGYARAIGVSNYSTAQIDAIVRSTGVTPAVNQIKWSPRLFDPVRLRENRDRAIQLEGFSAIRLTDLNDPTLVPIAEAHAATTAQVLLRWQIQHGVIAIPRSITPARIRENIDIWGFELEPGELARIDAMSTVVPASPGS